MSAEERDTESEPSTNTFEGQQVAFIEIGEDDDLAAVLGGKSPNSGFHVGGSDKPGTYRLIREPEDTEDPDEPEYKKLTEEN